MHLNRLVVRVATFSAMLIMLFCAHLSLAQGRGTVFGTVVDPTGSVIPGAAVTLVNAGTEQTQNAVSGKDGSFVIPAVNPGTYMLKVTAAGFETSVTNNIVLQVDENRKVSPSLTVGSISEEVQVTDAPAEVDTRSATLMQVVDSERVKDLPLNGRNPLDLQLLVPGAGGRTNQNGQQSQNRGISFNGSRYNENNYTLDGVDNEDPFFNLPSVVPNPDALDQFSIKTSNYGAGEGRGSGAQVNAIIKSGTNKLHGSLFEYVRNRIFDAKPYFAGAAPTPTFRRNQYGGSIGGPILHDKLFYFGSFQRTKEHASPNAQTLFLPSSAELAGNFAELCPAGFNSTTGACLSTATGNKQLTIPGTKTIAKFNNLAAYLYQPSINFVNTFVPAANSGPTTYVYTPPNDLTENQYIARLDHALRVRDQLNGHFIYVKSNSTATAQAQNLPGFFATVDYTNYHVAINEIHTFSNNLLNVATVGFLDVVRLQSPNVPVQKTWADLGAGTVRADVNAPIMYATLVATYFNANSTAPLQQYRKEFQYADTLTWTLRSHSLSFGGDVRQGYTRQAQSFQADPQLSFAATYTGNQLADFLTGRLNQLKQQSPNEGRPHAIIPDAFAQDDWKVTQRLTLNLGVRWEPFVPYKDELGRLAQFRPGVQSSVYPKAPLGYVFPGDAGVPESTFGARYGQFSPRFGLAYNVFGDGKTSFRAGAGVYYATLRTQAFNSESLNQPYAIALTLAKPSGGLAAPYKDIGGAPYPFTPPTAAQAANYTFTTPLSSINDYDPNFRNSRTEQWNVSVQQQFSKSIVGTLAYVGSVGEHLYLSFERNPQVAGVRIIPNYSSISRFLSGGHSTYHSLQSTVNKRLTHGVTILASYTWSKALDNNTVENVSVANPFCLPCNRGLSDFDFRHNFVASGIWSLPQLKQGNAIAHAVTNNWKITGIWSMQTGSPFTVISGVDNSQSGVASDLADRIAPVVLNTHASRSVQVNQGYFNQSAFTTNAIGTFGNSGRNTYSGPGQDVVTLGVSKTLVNVERVKLEFRAEAFNAFNHPSLNNPVANVSSATFGKINSAGDPRVGQAALRLEF